MQFKTILIFTTCLIFLFVSSSCNKNDIANNQPTTPLIVVGVITNQTGVPLQNVSVKVGSQQVSTDNNGHFRAANATFITSETFVTASLAGYFTGSRTFYPRENSNNFLRIQLMSRTEAGVINATSGGIVNVGNAKINFSPNSFSLENGSSYNGPVSVKAVYLDPADPDMHQQMPGDLRGLNTTGQQRGLKTYGMLNVELETNTGQKLQLTSGSVAQIDLPVPSGLAANAAVNVPLWYFDETVGLWKEEGMAQKTGNRYKGTVSHFTFWNVDEPYQFVKIEMRIVNQLQQAIQGSTVKLTSMTDSSSTYDYTDATGFVDGFVPINTSLKREIYNECDELISTDIIGPFSTNINTGTLQITSLTNQQTISGTVTNCASLPVASGYVIINMPGYTVYSNINNGAFSATFTNCNASISSAQITAVDNTTQQQGNPVTVQLSSAIVTTGVIQACGISSDEFITITVNDSTRTWSTTPYDIYLQQDSIPNSGFYDIYLGAYNNNNGGSADIILSRSADSVNAPFNVNVQSLSIFDQLAAPNMLGDYFLNQIIQPARLTTYGAVGTLITGSFSGIFIRSNQSIVDTVRVTVNFRVRRE